MKYTSPYDTFTLMRRTSSTLFLISMGKFSSLYLIFICAMSISPSILHKLSS